LNLDECNGNAVTAGRVQTNPDDEALERVEAVPPVDGVDNNSRSDGQARN